MVYYSESGKIQENNMSKYSLVKLILENDEENGQARFREKSTLKLYPEGKSLDEIIKALENAEHYGRYISNLRNLPYYSKKFNEKFGTPLQRRSFSKGGKVVSTAKAASYNAEEGEVFLGSLLNQESDAKKAKILKSIVNWKSSPDNTHLILMYDAKNTIDTVFNKVLYILNKANMQQDIDYKMVKEK